MPRIGGRQKGTLNKKTVERLAAAAAAGGGAPSDEYLASLKSALPPYRLERTEALVPYARNARTHSPAQIELIVRLITEYGWTNPILVDGKLGVIAGHGRLLAARRLGMDVVPVIELSHLSPAQRQAYVLADNASATKAGWDDELLRFELGELRDAGFDLSFTGFDASELGDLFDEPELPEAAALGDDKAILCPECGHRFTSRQSGNRV